MEFGQGDDSVALDTEPTDQNRLAAVVGHHRNATVLERAQMFTFEKVLEAGHEKQTGD